MPAADVQQLVQDLSDGLADATAAGTFYTDVLTDLALDPSGFHVDVQSIGVTAGVTSIDLPTAVVTELAFIYDDRHLTYANTDEAGLFSPTWRGLLGEPRCWIDEITDRHTIRLLPRPAHGSSGTVDPTIAGPGDYRLTVLYTYVPTDPSPDAELAVALEILAREFARDSDHTDSTASEMCRTLAGTLFKMLGVALDDHLPPVVKSDLEGT
jgi:hypothetical protein